MSHSVRPESGSTRRSSAQEEALTCGAIVLLAVPAVYVAVLFVAMPHPLAVLQSVVLEAIPIAIWALLIRHYLRDPCVSRSFLVKQFFLGAVPLNILVCMISVCVLIGTFLLVLLTEFLDGRLESLMDIDPSAKINSGYELSWKSTLLLLIAPFSIAVVEEAAKFFLARRYLRLVLTRQAGLEGEGTLHGYADRFNYGADSRPRQASIGCRGVLACACTGALGFASARHITDIGTLLSLGEVGRAIMACLVQFPLQLGTTFYIGLAMAQRTVLRDSVSVLRAFAIGVYVNGAAHVFPFAIFMVEEGVLHIPLWPLYTFMPLFYAIIGVPLILVCISIYSVILGREHMLLGRAPVLPTSGS